MYNLQLSWWNVTWFWKAISDACKVSATFSSELYESEVPDEYERQVDEDEELQQIIDGKLCMKIYDFSGGTVKIVRFFDVILQNLICLYFL